MSQIVSIITPSYNQGKFLAAAIDSVISQRGDFYIDYQIIDGGSSDDSAEIIKGYEKEICVGEKQEINGQSFYKSDVCKGISFRWVSEPDRGQVDGINKGLDKMIGDVFCYLNSDDVFHPGAFQTVVEAFSTDSEVSVVYGGGLEIDEGGKIIGIYPVKDVKMYDLRTHNFITQPSTFVKSSMVSKVGKFHPRINNSFDYEYWLRLYTAKEKFQLVNSILSSTRIYRGTKTSQNRSQIHLETYAIMQHYAGKLPLRRNIEFTMGLSLLGRLTWLYIRISQKMRNLLLYFLGKIYLGRQREAIEKKRQQLFMSAGSDEDSN